MRMVHVTIHTNKFEEEVKFYQEELNLKIVREIHGENEIAFLADSVEETQVEIIKDALALNSGNQFFQIGFETEDAEKKREDMLSRGFAVEDIREVNPATSFFFTCDPAGVKVQFISYKK